MFQSTVCTSWFARPWILGNLSAFPLRKRKQNKISHRAAKGGRQKGIGKKVTKNEKKRLPKCDRKRAKGYQKVTENNCECPTPFCLPPFCGTTNLQIFICNHVRADGKFLQIPPNKRRLFRVARLQKEVGTKDVSRGTNFLKKGSEIFPWHFWAFILCWELGNIYHHHPESKKRKIFRGKLWLHPPLRQIWTCCQN